MDLLLASWNASDYGSRGWATEGETWLLIFLVGIPAFLLGKYLMDRATGQRRK